MLDASEPLAHKLLRKGAWLYAFIVLTAPLGYLIRMVIARDLSLGDFGMLYGVMTLITLLWSYNDLGFSEALNYFLPKRAVAKDWAGVTRLAFYALVLQVVTSCVLALGLWALADPLSRWLFHDLSAAPVLRIYTLFLLGHGLFQAPMAVFGALQDVKASKGVELARLVATLGFVAAVSFAGYGSAVSFAWSWVSGVGVATVATWIVTWRRLAPYFDRSGLTWAPDEFFPVMRYAVWSVLAANVGTLLSQLDTLFVIYFLGSQANGLYSSYLSLMALPFLFVSPAVAFLFPVFSELHARGDSVRILELKRVAYRHLSILGVYCGSFFIGFGPALAAFFFGEKFHESGLLMAWSGPFLAFNFLLQVNFMLLAGTGRAKNRMGILLWGMCLNLSSLALFFVGIPPLGILPLGLPGAALSSGLGWVLIWFLSLRATREYPVPFDWPRLLLNCLIAACLVAASLRWVGLFPTSGWFGLALLLAGGAAVHILAWASVNLRDLRVALSHVRSLRASIQKPA